MDCKIVDVDDRQARLTSLAEDLCRKRQSVLVQSEQLTEYANVFEGKVSGQLVQKHKKGRPFGGDAEYARRLPEAIGRTPESRRKTLVRARKIAKIHPEAKEVIRPSVLANNQSLLLKVAARSDWKAQKKKAEELIREIEKTSARGAKSSAKKPSANDDPVSESGSDASPPTKTKETTYEMLENLWKKKGARLWAYTPFTVRERFQVMLRRSRCKAPADAEALVRAVFSGREKVSVRQLYGYAKTRGITKSAIVRILQSRNYKRKRPGKGLYLYLNPDPHWKDRMRAVTDKELEASKEGDPPIRERQRPNKSKTGKYLTID